MLERRLEQIDRPEHVDRRVVFGPRDRDPHVDLSGEVVTDVRLDAREELVLRLADVPLDELHALGEVLALARREIVEHDDVLAPGDERLHDVRADEPRSSGNQDGHRPILSRCS